LEKKVGLCLILTLVIITLVLVYWVREPARQEAATTRIQGEAVERGADIYLSGCIGCHGRTGNAPSGINLPQTQLEKLVLTKLISRGTGGMPAFGNEEGGSLTKHQISDLVTFIRNWDQSLIGSSPITPTVTPPEEEITPPIELEKGQITYNSLGCALCHGDRAQGASGPPLKGIDPETIREVVRSGIPGMPGYNTSRLSDLDLNNIITFLASLE
jgi:mono/diheme cytochrome c family protein